MAMQLSSALTRGEARAPLHHPSASTQQQQYYAACAGASSTGGGKGSSVVPGTMPAGEV